MGNKMFSDIKAKEETVKCDSGEEDQQNLLLKEIKYTGKHLSKCFISCLSAPFTKLQVRKSM